MKKYELRKNSIEIKWKDRKNIKPGITTEEDYPEIIKIFDNEEDAVAELKKYETSISITYAYSGLKYLLVEEYYVEINEYDEEDEWINGCDIVDYSKMEIELVEKRSREPDKVIATFDNMRDAENALLDEEIKAYDEDSEKEYHLRF